MSRLTQALMVLRPGAEFSDSDGTLEGVRWDTPDVVPPTQGEVDAALARLDVPEQVTAAQIIRALDHEGLLSGVKAAVTQAGGLTLELWNHAPFFHRGDPLIAGIAAALGKSEDEVDELFRLAATF